MTAATAVRVGLAPVAPKVSLFDRITGRKGDYSLEAQRKAVAAEEEAQRQRVLARVAELQAIDPMIRVRSNASSSVMVTAANHYIEVYIAHLFKAGDDGTPLYIDSDQRLLLKPFWSVVTRRRRSGAGRVVVQHMASRVIRSVLIAKARQGEEVPFRFDSKRGNRWYLAAGFDLFDAMRWAMNKPFADAEWRKYHQPLRDKARLYKAGYRGQYR